MDFIANMRQEQKSEQVIQADLRKTFNISAPGMQSKEEERAMKKYRHYLNKPQDKTDQEFARNMREFNHNKKYQNAK